MIWIKKLRNERRRNIFLGTVESITLYIGQDGSAIQEIKQ